MAASSIFRTHKTPAALQGPRIILLLATLALILLGLVMVYSASSVKSVHDGISGLSSIVNQLIYVAVGVILAVIVWRWVPTGVFKGRVVWLLWAIAMALIVLTFLAGTSTYGAKRWLEIGPISIQPSEFAKVALLLVAVRIVSEARDSRENFGMTLVKGLVFLLVPLLFIYKAQSDLGTTLLCLLGIAAVMLLGGVSARLLTVLAVLAVIFAAYAVFGTGYRSDRLVYLDPWNDGQNGYGDGYNMIRSYYALAEGGLFGVGLGNSHEKYSYLFASDSDFIFAVIGEEMGLIGAIVVIGLYLLVLLAGFAIARQAADRSSMMIAGGCTMLIVGQAFLNIGCVIGVLPTTGKPLPLVSAGGSSMISTLFMIGLILAVSREADALSVHDRRREDLRIIHSEHSHGPERAYVSGHSFPSGRLHNSGRSSLHSTYMVRSSRPLERGRYR